MKKRGIPKVTNVKSREISFLPKDVCVYRTKSNTYISYYGPWRATLLSMLSYRFLASQSHETRARRYARAPAWRPICRETLSTSIGRRDARGTKCACNGVTCSHKLHINIRFNLKSQVRMSEPRRNKSTHIIDKTGPPRLSLLFPTWQPIHYYSDHVHKSVEGSVIYDLIWYWTR